MGARRHAKRAYPEIVKLWEDSIGGGPAIGDQTRSETLALTRAVVELEGAAYRHLARAAAPPPRQVPPRAAEAVAKALELPDPLAVSPAPALMHATHEVPAGAEGLGT